MKNPETPGYLSHILTEWKALSNSLEDISESIEEYFIDRMTAKRRVKSKQQLVL